jgi:hypothetical protein
MAIEVVSEMTIAWARAVNAVIRIESVPLSYRPCQSYEV